MIICPSLVLCVAFKYSEALDELFSKICRMTRVNEWGYFVDHRCPLFHVWPFRALLHCCILSAIAIEHACVNQVGICMKIKLDITFFLRMIICCSYFTRISFTSVLINLTMSILLLPGLNLELRIHTPREPQDLPSLLSPEIRPRVQDVQLWCVLLPLPVSGCCSRSQMDTDAL